MFGNFTAGQDVGLGYGDFNTTGIEDQGLLELQNLLSSSLPEQFAKGNAALDTFLNPDPSFVASQFDPFKAQVEREIGDAVNKTKASLLGDSNPLSGISDTFSTEISNVKNSVIGDATPQVDKLKEEIEDAIGPIKRSK